MWLLLATAVVALQLRSGAYGSDLSSPDEAAHFVSALLVRDYIAAGFPAPPMQFAQRFYLHYPKVAIGHWPPVFYASSALWMLLFGRSKAAMLAFMAALCAALCIGIYEFARRDCGEVAAFACALIFATAPLVRTAASTIMPDLPLGALMFAAAVAYGFYLELGRRKYALISGMLAALAVGTHGRGLIVLLVPALALWMTRARITPARIAVIAVVVTAVIGAPVLMRQSLPISVASIGANALLWAPRCGRALAWFVPALALLASVRIVGQGQRGRWTAMAALVAANWIFFALVNPLWEPRYLMTAAPAVAVLGAAGWRYAANWSFGKLRPAMAVLGCAAVIVNAAPALRQPDLGYSSALARLPRLDRVSLVAGDPLMEGAFVAAMALHDRRFEHVVLRGSKALARSTWAGADYRLTFSRPAEVRDFLDRMGVGTVVVQRAAARADVPLLETAVTGDRRWREATGIVAGVRVFQRTVPPERAPLRLTAVNPGGLNWSFEITE